MMNACKLKMRRMCLYGVDCYLFIWLLLACLWSNESISAVATTEFPSLTTGHVKVLHYLNLPPLWYRQVTKMEDFHSNLGASMAIKWMLPEWSRLTLGVDSTVLWGKDRQTTGVSLTSAAMKLDVDGYFSMTSHFDIGIEHSQLMGVDQTDSSRVKNESITALVAAWYW